MNPVLSKLLGKLLSNTFLRNVSWGVLGSAASQFIFVAGAFFLLKLYTPDQFGILAIYAAIAIIAGTFVTARYEVVIPIPAAVSEAAGLLGVSILLTFIGSFLIFAIQLAWIPSLFESLGAFIYLLPLQVLIFGLSETHRYWLARFSRFEVIAIADVTRMLVIVTMQCMLASSYGESAVGLIIGLSAGWAAFWIITIPFVLKNLPISAMNIRNMVGVAVLHRGNLFLIPSQGLNRISSRMPIFLLEYIFGPAVTGCYEMASRFLYGPAALIGESIRAVFFPKASMLFHKQGECRDLFRKVIKWSLLLSATLFIPMSILAPWFISLLSSILNIDPNEWAATGQIIQILAPFYIIRLINAPIMGLWIVAGRQRILLVWECCFLITLTLGLLSGLPTQSLTWSLVGYGVAKAIAFTVNIYACSHFANGRWTRRMPMTDAVESVNRSD